MKQRQFESQHQAMWQRFSSLLDNDVQSQTPSRFLAAQAATARQSDVSTSDSTSSPAKVADQGSFLEPNASGYEFIQLYRIICQHYALAKQRHYSPQLVQYLNELVVLGHQELYQRDSHIWTRIYRFFTYTFPVRLRSHSGLLLLSLLCFLIPAILMAWACYEHADMLYSIMPSEQVRQMEEMYNPANDMIGRDSSRRSDTDIAMFGFYIYNNIGIDFRIYGMGIFAGIGTLLSLLYNGLVIGGVAGHLSGLGFSETFWPFVATHSSFELTAAVISGAAGLRLAQSLFMPGNFKRIDAFKIAGKQSIELLIGAATMTFIAAFIEAFWSSSSIIPAFVKYTVAAISWLAVLSYLYLAGRREHAELMRGRNYSSSNYPSIDKQKPAPKSANSAAVSDSL
ncbi:stage II sporulation protein M [Psychrobacter pygoscelis]|uniref:stage II sporulation protein M n=1 Tax=Psychrobacter pygoscelis TaxID=2488563 RepID=UPI0010390BC9|nr:stage II sporulation protein M [Psychrobacter pygoscelis]